MSESKTTEAGERTQWRVADGFCQAPDGIGQALEIETDGLTVALVYPDGDMEDHARLIAAAPELLAACKRLVAITRNADAQQLKIAIAAIDKAEGRA